MQPAAGHVPMSMPLVLAVSRRSPPGARSAGAGPCGGGAGRLPVPQAPRWCPGDGAAPAPSSAGPASPAEQARLAARGAAPGGTDGPGGFVARGSARNFYAGAGGRLWYYLNNYYWVPADLEASGVWIRAEVRADFNDLLRWPDRGALRSPPTKTTVEYWAVGPGQRSVRLDNHKDYWLLDPKTCAGSARVEVTLTLGRLHVRDEQGAWATPTERLRAREPQLPRRPSARHRRRAHALRAPRRSPHHDLGLHPPLVHRHLAAHAQHLAGPRGPRVAPARRAAGPAAPQAPARHSPSPPRPLWLRPASPLPRTGPDGSHAAQGWCGVPGSPATHAQRTDFHHDV